MHACRQYTSLAFHMLVVHTAPEDKWAIRSVVWLLSDMPPDCTLDFQCWLFLMNKEFCHFKWIHRDTVLIFQTHHVNWELTNAPHFGTTWEWVSFDVSKLVHDKTVLIIIMSKHQMIAMILSKYVPPGLSKNMMARLLSSWRSPRLTAHLLPRDEGMRPWSGNNQWMNLGHLGG